MPKPYVPKITNVVKKEAQQVSSPILIKQPSYEIDHNGEKCVDLPFQDKSLITKDFGILLLAFANYTLIKFF